MSILSTMIAPIRWASSRLSAAWHVSPSGIASVFGVTPTASGVNVTERTALNLSAVWCAVRLLSETIACLPMHLYRMDGETRQRVTAKEHPVARLLARRPNPYMSWFTFVETLQGHLVTWGRAAAEIERDNASRVIGLWPVTPDRISVDLDRDGSVIYRVDGSKKYDPLEIVFVPGFGFDGLCGYSPIAMARESLGLAVSAERYGAQFFGAGGKPTGVLSSKKKLSEQGRAGMRADWIRLQSPEAGAAGRIAVLQEDTTYTAISLPPDDSQFLETRKFSVNDIARWFRVPPHLIGDLERSTNNNIEHQGREFLTYSILPWLERWVQELWYKLLDDDERDDYFFAHTVEQLLVADIATRYAAYATGRQWGWFSANDVRKKEDLPPIPGGGVYLSPANMMPADQLGKVAPKPSGLVGPDGSPAAEWIKRNEHWFGSVT